MDSKGQLEGRRLATLESTEKALRLKAQLFRRDFLGQPKLATISEESHAPECFRFGSMSQLARASARWGDLARSVSQNGTVNAQPEDDWHLREWMHHLRKKQASLVADLGWTRGRASKVFNGSLPYRREVLNEVAGWLGIKPYELLMKPEEAIALRRLRETAKIIAQESD